MRKTSGYPDFRTFIDYFSINFQWFNGQEFTFNGYLPIDKSEKKKQILQLESLVQKTGYSQIFMETPYRNNALFEDLTKFLSPNTKLCIAANINDPEQEFIKTKTIKEWQKQNRNSIKFLRYLFWENR
jgi:16S rRNA C1402 (ribose-2'-O) methylase RsmI